MSELSLITISGPSLTGKSKLAEILKPFGFDEVVSTTTRPARKGEVNGVNYHFVTPEQFKEMIKNDQLIEYALVGDNYYGTSRQSLEEVFKKGKNGVSVVEPQGAQNIGIYCNKNSINVYQVFINNDLDTLLKRFLQRFKDDDKADINTYTRRLTDMNTLERKEWVEKALNGEHHYDKIFDNFVIENEKDVAQDLIKSLDKKIKKNHKVGL